MPAMETIRQNRPSMASQLRRRFGILNKKASARVAPPADGQKSLNGWLSAVPEVVETVSVAVCAVEPLIVTEGGAMLHVAGSFAAAGVIAQVRLTVPVNPFDGVMVMVEVFPVVAPGSSVIVVPVTANVGGGPAVTSKMKSSQRRRCNRDGVGRSEAGREGYVAGGRHDSSKRRCVGQRAGHAWHGVELRSGERSSGRDRCGSGPGDSRRDFVDGERD